jgi:hypothetical protein
MENVRKYIKLYLATSNKMLDKKIASPYYDDHQIFSKKLAAIKLIRKIVNLNKPIYTGFSVLDLSKLLMYSFHYNYIVKKYGTKAKLCLTDTDSLLYDIKTYDIYDDMLMDIELFDTSGYNSDHKLYSTANKKVYCIKSTQRNNGGIAQV